MKKTFLGLMVLLAGHRSPPIPAGSLPMAATMIAKTGADIATVGPVRQR